MASAKPQSPDDLKATSSFAKTDVTRNLLSAGESGDAIQRVQIELNEVLEEFKIANEAYQAEENRERELFHRDEVTPAKAALKPVKSTSTLMEGGLPGNVIDETAINPQDKQPYEPNETPQPPKHPLNAEAPEDRHTMTPNREGLPHDIKTSNHHGATFVGLMETQERHNQTPMQLVRHQQHSTDSTATLTLPQTSMQVFSGGPIDYCDFIHARNITPQVQALACTTWCSILLAPPRNS